MGRRRSFATLLALRAAFERSGLAVAEPDPPLVQWVSPWRREPVGRVIHEYDPISPERLK
jgi:hypothetical protein